MQSNNIFFRASSVGNIMTDPQGKTNLQKYDDAWLELGKHRTEYEQMKNKETKSAAKKRDQIVKLEKLISELEPIKNKSELSTTCKTHLIDVFASYYYKRKEEISSKFLSKGNAREEDSITLLSRVTKVYYEKNVHRISNEFIQGEPDLFLGNSILTAKETIDTKTSWSLHTFLRAKFKELDSMYYWQGQCYMDLTGSEKHTVAYCLVNGTDTAITDEKRRASFEKGMTDQHGNPTDKYLEKCKQIEINHIFDLESFINENPHYQFDNDINQWNYDIPINERVHLISFERSQSDIDKMHNRVRDCREWMEENLFNN